jgi:thioredoxin reductase (NADPH)
MNHSHLDCLIVGGGPAGLAAAIYLGRFRRRALVIDAGQSRVKWISCIRNYPGFPDGVSGIKLLEDMRTQANRFGANVEKGTVSEVNRFRDGFSVSANGRTFTAATVLIASGVEDNLPILAGFKEDLIVRDKVRLCPVCDGFEFIDRTIAIWGEAERSVKEALFLRTYSKSITVVVASGTIGASDRERLAEAGIQTVEWPPARLKEQENAIAVIDAEGRARLFDVIYLAMSSLPRTGLALAMGADINKNGCLLVDKHQETASPGLYAAGDIVDELNQISVAVAHAAVAATAIHNAIAEQRLERL